MKHLVKKRIVVRKRNAGPSALAKFKETSGCTDEMIEEARREQNQDIPPSQMAIIASVQKKLQRAKPKPANLMKRDRKKG